MISIVYVVGCLLSGSWSDELRDKCCEMTVYCEVLHGSLVLFPNRLICHAAVCVVMCVVGKV